MSRGKGRTGFGWDIPVEAGDHPSSRKKAVTSKRLFEGSACARLSEMAPSRPRVKRSGPWGGLPVLYPSFCSGSSRDRTGRNCRSSDAGHSTWRNQPPLPKKTGPVKLVEGFSTSMVRRHRPSSLSGFWSHRVMAWTMASQHQLCRTEVSCHVFGNGSQKGSRCETSKSLSYGHLSADAVPLFFNAVSEALAIQGTLEPGRLPSAMLRTTAWGTRTSSSLFPGRRLHVLWVEARRSSCRVQHT